MQVLLQAWGRGRGGGWLYREPSSEVRHTHPARDSTSLLESNLNPVLYAFVY